jgi:trigger factor
MRVEEIKLDGLARSFRFVFPIDQVKLDTEKKISDFAKKAQMPGFRVGKVPVSLVKSKYGAELFYEVSQSLVDSSIKKLIDENKFDILHNDIQIDNLVMEEDKDVECVIKFEVMPVIEMPNFKEITLDRVILKFSEEEIAKTRQEILDGYSEDELLPGSEVAKMRDIVEIDFEGFKDGVAFEGGKAENYKLSLGSGNFIPGFEEQLEGVKAGDSLDINVTFPENYGSSNLAGAPVVFKIKVHNVYRLKPLELTEELVKEKGYKDLADFEVSISDRLALKYKRELEQYTKMALFDELEKFLDFEMPASVFNKESENLWSQFQSEFSDSITEEEKEAKKKYCDKIAARRVRIGLLLSEYAKKNNIEINQSEFMQTLMILFYRATGQIWRGKDISSFYKEHPALYSLALNSAIEDKSVEALLKNEVTMVEKSLTVMEFEELVEKMVEASNQM